MHCPKCHRRYEDDHAFCPHDGERLVASIDVKRIRSKPAEQVGKIIGGRYQIRGLIGRGAMAQVFLAQDRTTGVPVALKVLESKHLKEPRVRARFILEAKAVAKVTHPNIVTLLDVGLHEGGAPFLVMEFLFGESLGDYLRRERMLPISIGLPFAAQLASALVAAHREGIVHRDIKPDNVFLLGEKGAPYTVKLVDFGLAKLLEHSGMTQAGIAVGTVEYMAPEQAVSDGADARTDVYGLGVLLYRTFTGRLPFACQRDIETLAHHLVVDPEPPGLGAMNPGAGLEAVILRALRKRPENRYPTMQELADDLARLATAPGARIPLHATRPLVEPSDTYTPRSPFSITATRFLYMKLGKSPPPSPGEER
jgi:eukaryotic-like serine/threonine-protein kinase